MLKYPFFSIIVPTYNSYKTLDKTIKSVLNQRFTDFELIIIDDGSTDNTGELIKYFVDSRIIYKKITNSGGPARPRNIGLQLARGSWISFLDSDDIWTDNKLQETFKHIDLRPEVDIWTSGYFIFDENGIISERMPSTLVNRFSFKTLLIYSNPFVTSALSIKKEKIGSTLFDESRNIASVEDLDFLVSLSIKGLKADKINEKLVHYYHNEVGISKNQEKHLESLKFFFDKYSNKSNFFLKIRSKSNFNWVKSTILIQNKKTITSIYFFSLSFILSPIDRLIYILKYFKK